MANPSKLDVSSDAHESESYLRRIKAEIRKTNKPIMEKKRRARINHYLNDLKALLLDTMKQDPIRHSKLEKADILDLTVKHLQDMESRNLAIAMATDPTVTERFKNGFNDCIDEISKYFDCMNGLNDGLKQRMVKHLQSIVKINHVHRLPSSLGVKSSDDINNNGNVRANIEHFRLIPTLLPAADNALFTPNCHGFGIFSSLRAPTLYPMPNVKQTFGKTFEASPPLSPMSDNDSVSHKYELKTPTTKNRTILADNLLKAFPTPPTPDDSGLSPFRPRLRLNIASITNGSESTTAFRPPQHDEPPSHSDNCDNRSMHQQGDNHEAERRNNPNSDMWRPW